MEPKQEPKVVEDLLEKLQSRGVFFEDNIYLYDEEGGKKSDFIINKFKFYTAFFSDEEVANLEESRSFEDMETYFNLLVTKYSKVVVTARDPVDRVVSVRLTLFLREGVTGFGGALELGVRRLAEGGDFGAAVFLASQALRRDLQRHCSAGGRRRSSSAAQNERDDR